MFAGKHVQHLHHSRSQQVPRGWMEGVHTSTAREIVGISVPAQRFKAVVLHLFIKSFTFMPDT